jgi:PAS domain S-box-containing protein
MIAAPATLVVMSSVVSADASESCRAASVPAGQHHILEMIATSASLSDILTSLALLIESQLDGLFCSVRLLDDDGRLRHGAAPSLPEAYTKAIDGALSGPRAGSCGTAAYRKEPVIVTNIPQEPLWDDYSELAARHGLCACWSTPFFSRQGDVLGTFAVYCRTPRSPSSAETQRIQVATRIASIAVERSQNDVALRQSAEHYRALLENLNDIVYSVDVDGKVTYISPPVERLSGYRVGEIIGMPFGQFIHPDDLEILQESFANTLAGILASSEFRVLDKQGGVHWCRSSSRPQMVGERLVGITGVIVDITGHKTTREALHNAVQKYLTIYEEGIIGIFQTEPRGRYLAANPALARMLGYDSPNDLMASVSDISHQIYVDSGRREEFKFLLEKDGRVRNFECQVYRKNGSKMWVSVTARAIYEDGRIVAYEGMNEDITDRKFLEEQLLQAQKMEAVGQLAGGIAHDFNNLLGVILGHGELLLRSLRSGDPLRRRIEQICQAGNRAVSLTGQLLAFSRQQIMRPVVLDLNLVIGNANDMIARLIGDGIRVTNTLDPALGRVKADASQVEQILMNLAINARDAMPEGGTLTIETSNVDIDRTAQRHLGAKEGNYALLTVTDTGTGMDEKTWQRHRARISDLLRHRQADRRIHLGQQRTWERDDLQYLPAAHRRICAGRETAA